MPVERDGVAQADRFEGRELDRRPPVRSVEMVWPSVAISGPARDGGGADVRDVVTAVAAQAVTRRDASAAARVGRHDQAECCGGPSTLTAPGRRCGWCNGACSCVVPHLEESGRVGTGHKERTTDDGAARTAVSFHKGSDSLSSRMSGGRRPRRGPLGGAPRFSRRRRPFSMKISEISGRPNTAARCSRHVGLYVSGRAPAGRRRDPA